MNKIKTKKELYRYMRKGWQLGIYAEVPKSRVVIQQGGLGCGGGVLNVEPALVAKLQQDDTDYLRPIKVNSYTTTFVIDAVRVQDKVKK